MTTSLAYSHDPRPDPRRAVRRPPPTVPAERPRPSSASSPPWSSAIALPCPAPATWRPCSSMATPLIAVGLITFCRTPRGTRRAAVGHVRPAPRRLAELAGRLRALVVASSSPSPTASPTLLGSAPSIVGVIPQRCRRRQSTSHGDRCDVDADRLHRGDRLAGLPPAPHPDAASATPRRSLVGFFHGMFHVPLMVFTTTYNSVGSRWIVVPTVVAHGHLRRRLLRLAQGPLRQRVAGRASPTAPSTSSSTAQAYRGPRPRRPRPHRDRERRRHLRRDHHVLSGPPGARPHLGRHTNRDPLNRHRGTRRDNGHSGRPEWPSTHTGLPRHQLRTLEQGPSGEPECAHGRRADLPVASPGESAGSVRTHPAGETSPPIPVSFPSAS